MLKNIVLNDVALALKKCYFDDLCSVRADNFHIPFAIPFQEQKYNRAVL